MSYIDNLITEPGTCSIQSLGTLIPHPMMLSLITSDAADECRSVDLGGRRIIKKIFFKQKTAYEMRSSLVGSEMCIRDRPESDARSVGQY